MTGSRQGRARAPVEDVQHFQSMWSARQPAQSSSTASSASSSTAAFRHDNPDPPSIEPSSEPGQLSQATPHGRSSSFTDPPARNAPERRSSSAFDHLSHRPPLVPLVKSLADLPFDILERIGELLIPAIVPARASGARTTSREWSCPTGDVVRFRSTCRAAWRATVGLAERVYNVGAAERAAEYSPEAVWDRVDAVALKAVALDGEPCRSTTSRSVPASKIRHLCVQWSMAGVWDLRHDNGSTTTELFVAKLAGMSRLESLALVWQDEEAVTRTSPYTVDTLPAEILVALSRHSTLRELYLCGVKLSRRLSSGDKVDDVPIFPSHLRALTLNACHDSALELVTLAPGATEVRVHRDFASPPRVQPDCFWDINVWSRVEEVDIVGLSGTVGRPLLRHWRNELEILRSLSPPPFIPLRSLRLVEPFLLNDVRSILLPTFALLPQLRHFAIFIWNSRDFGPSFFGEIHEAMPELDELGVALDSECLTWWPGSLASYAGHLERFRNLRVFTWNYTPYADLDFPSTRCHVFPLVKYRLFPHVPTLRTLRWFGHDPHLRLLDVDGADVPGRAEWAWSDDPRARPVTIPWMRDALPPVPPLDLGSAGAAQESYGARLAGDPFSSPSGSSSPFVAGSRVLAEDGDEVESSAVTSGGGRGRRAKPRKSVLEQLEAARVKAAADEVAAQAASRPPAEGKGKGKVKAVLRERQSSAGEQQDDVFWSARRA
ncbi:hypothetical protein JCM8208_001406 [Rhodotorula glutinis]